MDRFIGIDLGTSSVKLLLTDEEGRVEKTTSRSYPISFPQVGWSEQDPADWWRGVLSGLAEILDGIDKKSVRGICCAGQMHGLVALDENDEVIRPCILWNDGRTAPQTDWLNTEVGRSRLTEFTGNIAFAGFTAPKILWMRENEPENFTRISRIMLPKDYINYMLTGVHSCDYSDASGMLLLDVRNRCWSREMMEICHVSEDMMPFLFESWEVTGVVRSEIAEMLGLSTDVRVCAGAGDNAAAAVGTGTVGKGACNISLGTSGTIFIPSDGFAVDPNNALHAFCHADGRWHLMGCILSAASCNNWLCDSILGTKDFAAEQEMITDDMLGRNRVFFLPYLMGERSPINDTDARACFVGMSMDSRREDMVQAVLEGVAFALRDCMEVAHSLGVHAESTMLCGGGAKSVLWRRIIANVLDMTIDIPSCEEGPGYGAAMLAMVGCGVFSTVEECCRALIGVRESISPDPDIAAAYNERYARFRRIYPALKGFFSGNAD